MNHEWVLKFVGYYIQDPNILRLVEKYLKAGVLEAGEYHAAEEGSSQGNIISPRLANIYMHHVLILWFREYWTKRGSGDNFLENYADDYIAGFENKWEAEKYYEQMQERLGKFGLEIETSKSRVIEFGRYAKERRKRKGKGKPETFDFLVFTFYCGESRKGTFVVKAKTSGKKYRMKIKELKKWLKGRLMKPIRETGPMSILWTKKVERLCYSF